MAPPSTLEELEEIRERDRQEKRVKGLAWAFTGVPHSNEHEDSSSTGTSGKLALQTKSPEIRDFERQKERVNGLGWAFSGVHVSSAHEDWTKMSVEEKEALQKSLSMSQENARPNAKLLGNGIQCKWSFVSSGKKPPVLMQVIEDTGSTYNWISRAQAERCGLQSKRGAPIRSMTLTGEVFNSDEYVDVPWLGKVRGTDQFYIAPPSTPIQMLVGNVFTRNNPGVFMDQEPGCDPMLLVMASRMTIEEKEQMEATRARHEEEARILEEKRSQHRLRGMHAAPAVPVPTQSASFSRQTTLTAPTSQEAAKSNW